MGLWVRGESGVGAVMGASWHSNGVPHLGLAAPLQASVERGGRRGEGEEGRGERGRGRGRGRGRALNQFWTRGRADVI